MLMRLYRRINAINTNKTSFMAFYYSPKPSTPIVKNIGGLFSQLRPPYNGGRCRGSENPEAANSNKNREKGASA
jgi:hypothetical protein